MTATGLLGPASLRQIADRIGLRPTKTKGQNFVHDPNTVRRIVTLAEVGPEDVVIEVGPGLGSLTLGLLETGATVIAIEIDTLLAEQLPKTVEDRFPSGINRLHVVTSDALDVTELPMSESTKLEAPGESSSPDSTSIEDQLQPTKVPQSTKTQQPTKVVANLPYNVSVPVLLHLLETFDSWTEGLVMVQLEVADRLVAEAGTKVYGAPSVKLAWYADSEKVGTVPPKVFWPVPNVDSGLVKISRRPAPETTASRKTVFEVVDAAFGQRRKMLRGALSGLMGSSAAASEICLRAGVNPELRGEKLTISDFVAIAEQIEAQRG